MAELAVQGQTVLVDDCDVSLVAGHSWRIGTKGYVVTTRLPDCYTMRMHRLIMGLDKGDPQQVDHRNRDPLDNRRANLRVTDAQGNSENKGVYRNAAGFATQQRSNGRWQSRIRFRKVCYNLGTYDTKEEATAVAEAFRAECRG